MSSWGDRAQPCLQAAYVAAQFSPRVKFLSPVLTALNCYRRWPRSRRCASPSSDLARRTARHDLPSMSRDGSRWQKRVPGQERERKAAAPPQPPISVATRRVIWGKSLSARLCCTIQPGTPWRANASPEPFAPEFCVVAGKRHCPLSVSMQAICSSTGAMSVCIQLRE